MRTKILIGALVISTAISKAQNYSERVIESFSKIQVTGSAKVYFTNSDTLKLRVTGDQDDVAGVETKVENGTLYISTKGKQEEDVTVLVRHNTLNEIMCSGAAEFKTTNQLKNDSISFNVSGAASVNVKTDSRSVYLIQSGASNLTLSGKTNELTAEISGASTLKAYQLHATNANVITTGASNAKVFVNSKLKANATGASTIKIKGEVKDLSAEASTTSSIMRILDNDKNGTDKNDSTTFNWNGKKVIIIAGEKDKDKKKSVSNDFNHWAGFSVGINGLLTPDAGIKMEKPYGYLDLNYSRSVNFQLNFFQHNFHIYKNYVNLVTGFGIEWRRYMLDNKTNLRPDSSFTWGTIDTTNTFKYGKNLFKSTLIQVPLLLDFNTNKKSNKSFHVSVGVIGQFLVNSKTKQKLESNGNEFTKINRDSYNMVPWNLKAHASIGYSNFTVFGEYNITPLFYKGQGPQLYPFVAGVRLIAF